MGLRIAEQLARKRDLFVYAIYRRHGSRLHNFGTENSAITTDPNEALPHCRTVILALRSPDMGDFIRQHRKLLRGKAVLSCSMTYTPSALAKEIGHRQVAQFVPSVLIGTPYSIIPVFYYKRAVSARKTVETSPKIKRMVDSILRRLGELKRPPFENMPSYFYISGWIAQIAAHCEALANHDGLGNGFSMDHMVRTIKGLAELLEDGNSLNYLQKAISTKGGRTIEIIKAVGPDEIAARAWEAFCRRKS